MTRNFDDIDSHQESVHRSFEEVTQLHLTNCLKLKQQLDLCLVKKYELIIEQHLNKLIAFDERK